MTGKTSESQRGGNSEFGSNGPSVARVSISKLSITLALIFCLSVIMGTGPGVLLVNRPESIGGVPLVYAWGILWYCVQVAVVIAAVRTVWRSTDDRAHCEAPDPKSPPEREATVQDDGELPR